MDLIKHLHRQRDFSIKTFGPGDRTYGVTDHIRKELHEVIYDFESGANTLPEWIDIILLALDGAHRTGATPEEICKAIEEKQTINENRSWPDWKASDPNRAIEHDRN